ncbi:hypothetical protein GWI33_015141 [Rhynchophorus ferrugineus]|uniref:Uncharacterized protein n=1 Tax=Rhynchophorus ferrugineus TaxID=354439 RepID=A0A834MA16_RHYFE|nr:hypothetical protein GWI33_015141 [Rhynchophorus ferrugineus]
MDDSEESAQIGITDPPKSDRCWGHKPKLNRRFSVPSAGGGDAEVATRPRGQRGGGTGRCPSRIERRHRRSSNHFRDDYSRGPVNQFEPCY